MEPGRPFLPRVDEVYWVDTTILPFVDGRRPARRHRARRAGRRPRDHRRGPAASAGRARLSRCRPCRARDGPGRTRRARFAVTASPSSRPAPPATSSSPCCGGRSAPSASPATSRHPRATHRGTPTPSRRPRPEFMADSQTPRRLTDLALHCGTDQALRARLQGTVRNFLADLGRRTPSESWCCGSTTSSAASRPSCASRAVGPGRAARPAPATTTPTRSAGPSAATRGRCRHGATTPAAPAPVADRATIVAAVRRPARRRRRLAHPPRAWPGPSATGSGIGQAPVAARGQRPRPTGAGRVAGADRTGSEALRLLRATEVLAELNDARAPGRRLSRVHRPPARPHARASSASQAHLDPPAGGRRHPAELVDDDDGEAVALLVMELARRVGAVDTRPVPTYWRCDEPAHPLDVDLADLVDGCGGRRPGPRQVEAHLADCLLCRLKHRRLLGAPRRPPAAVAPAVRPFRAFPAVGAGRRAGGRRHVAGRRRRPAARPGPAVRRRPGHRRPRHLRHRGGRRRGADRRASPFRVPVALASRPWPPSCPGPR